MNPLNPSIRFGATWKTSILNNYRSHFESELQGIANSHGVHIAVDYAPLKDRAEFSAKAEPQREQQLNQTSALVQIFVRKPNADEHPSSLMTGPGHRADLDLKMLRVPYASCPEQEW